MHFDGGAVQANILNIYFYNLLLLQSDKEPCQNAGFAPTPHAVVNGIPLAKRGGQAAPFTPLFHDVNQGVEQLAVVDFDIAPLAWQAVFDALELVLCDFHAPLNTPFYLFVN